ncbi:MAG: hypothetical protein H5T65_07165 [Chloroflexi bacterium]|nr:hypothetical protein [Chloroflexota bacterium]
MPQPQFDILFVGDFAKDVLVHGQERVVASGGSVYYGAIAVARLGIRTGVITRLHPSDFGLLDELKAEGIAVYAQPAPQTSGIENIYNTADMDRRICHPIGHASLFDLDDLPRWNGQYVFIGPIMAGIVSLDLVKRFARKAKIALDIQGFVRVPRGNDLPTEEWPERRKGLALVHTLKLDQAEAEALTGETDPLAALPLVAAYGPKEIVLTHASGVTVWAEGKVYQSPFVAENLSGRTGRGDTCISTYLARRLTREPDEACRFAAAATSLKLSQPGPLRRSLAEIAALAETLPVRALR